jgi:hypothetical protein
MLLDRMGYSDIFHGICLNMVFEDDCSPNKKCNFGKNDEKPLEFGVPKHQNFGFGQHVLMTYFMHRDASKLELKTLRSILFP